MKFKIAKERLFWWPVKVSFPNPDPKQAGKLISQEFNMQFAALPKEEYAKAQAARAQMSLEEAVEHEHDLMIRVCRNWDDQVVDEEGAPVSFSEDVLRDLMSDGYFRIGLYSAYQQATSGEAARSKN